MSKDIIKIEIPAENKLGELTDPAINIKLDNNTIVKMQFNTPLELLQSNAGWITEALQSEIDEKEGDKTISDKLEKYKRIEEALTKIKSLGVKVNINDPAVYSFEFRLKETSWSKFVKEAVKSLEFKTLFNIDQEKLLLLSYKEALRESEKELKALKKEKFRKSGHLIEQTLKYKFPKDRKPDLFSLLEKDTIKTDIIETGRDISIEGIQLTNTESRLIDALSVLLHYNSQNKNPADNDYYAGLEVGGNWNTIQYGGEDRIAPKIAFSLYELTKEFYSDKTVSGTDVENIAKVLRGLHEKKFLIVYTETSHMEDGAIRERKIEEFQELVRILQLTETYTDRDGKITSAAEDTIVMLNPIFRAQISTKSVSYPVDINRRMMLAYGNWKVPLSIIKLRDYLLLEKSNKRKTPEIYLDRLYYKINEKYMKESRKKKVKEETYTALKTMMNLGLLEKYDIVTGATGEQKVIFTINLDWE